MKKITKRILIISLFIFGIFIFPTGQIEAVNFSITGASNTKLSVSLDLNKTVFSPGETMIVTASAVYQTCSNSNVNIEISGFLVNYYTIFPILNSTAGGGSTVFGSGSATVQTIPGNYTLRISTTTTIAPYMAAVNSSGGQVMTALTLMDLIFVGENAGYIYDGSVGTYGQFIDPSNGQILDIISAGGGQLEYSTFDIPYTVIPDPTVTVYVNGLKNPDPVNYDSGVKVTWDSYNANYCECTCVDRTTGDQVNCGSLNTSSCGAGVDLVGGGVRSIPTTIPNIKKTTTFKVRCSDTGN